jgi:hypothetical protein
MQRRLVFRGDRAGKRDQASFSAFGKAGALLTGCSYCGESKNDRSSMAKARETYQLAEEDVVRRDGHGGAYPGFCV